MGFDLSSRAESNAETAPFGTESKAGGTRGRKSMVIESEATAEDNLFVEEDNNAVVSEDEAEESEEESDDEESESEDESEEEEDDEWDERVRVLEDAKTMKKMVNFFFHPESPVEMDGFAPGRCFFNRPAAPEMVDWEERDRILEETKELKRLAIDYFHPERSVEVADPTLFGRNYFSRPSAPEMVDWGELARILEDAKQLKRHAEYYLHPERPVVNADPALFGRNYFSRPSAPETVDWEERARIMEEAKELKRVAVDYMHPERPVEVADPTLFGRSYFSRASAPEMMDWEERARILEEAKELKRVAVDYMHPERPVEVADPTLFGRSYFSRASAPEMMDWEERSRILEEAKDLKRIAVDYLHPERPVEVADPTLFGRSYFSRASAPEPMDWEERSRILEEAKDLKRIAVDYLHPERPVEVADPTLFGRSYFSRASAPEMVDWEERALVLEEAKEFKRIAVDYLHPERPVEVADPTLFGRNYFSRASAPEMVDWEELALILEEAKELKRLAVDYLHPERPVEIADPTLFGRNYFSRPSASEELVDWEERDRILQETEELKRLAVDYLHPERPVGVADPTLFGRNYFSRSSAPETDWEERALVLEEAKELKRLAVDYLHPELPVEVADPTLFGRNYFTRPSAPIIIISG